MDYFASVRNAGYSAAALETIVKSKPVSSGTSGRPRLLVVEDNPDTAFLIQTLLEDDFDISLAYAGEEALSLAREMSHDLVLMDINLGEGLNGTDVLHEMRKLPAYRRVPIVAVTAYAMPGDREHFLDVGFADYLSKPFEIERLVNLASDLIHRS